MLNVDKRRATSNRAVVAKDGDEEEEVSADVG